MREAKQLGEDRAGLGLGIPHGCIQRDAQLLLDSVPAGATAVGMVCISNLLSSGRAVLWGHHVLGFLQETNRFALFQWFLRHGTF